MRSVGSGRVLNGEGEGEQEMHDQGKIAKPKGSALPYLPVSPADYLATLAEPTRLRVLSALAGSPLYVSDLQDVLQLPQPTVSRHLRVLRDLGVVDTRRVASRVIYRLTLPPGATGRMIRAVLDALRNDPAFRTERAAARERDRGTAGAAPLATVHAG